jgi:glycosyltransferase involved in cell wall biosynthesis
MTNVNLQAACALSIVTPCYDEAESLPEFHRRTAAACKPIVGADYEIVLVDDGSRDDTWRVIEQLSAADPHVVGVRLMRNHGHQLAATAGVAMSRGERVMLIDADLQDPPELLAEMMAIMDSGVDVVYGKRIFRKGETWFKTTSATAFYKVLSRLSNVPIPRDAGDFRLMSRRVVDILLSMPERERFIRGMVSWIGGRQVPLGYERQVRIAGVTKYPLAKMIRFATDAITSFSTVPLRLAVWLGLFVATMAIFLLAFTFWGWAHGNVIAGWSSLMAAIALFAGVQLLVLGIIGEYLGRLVQETKGRPLFLIDSVVIRGRDHPLRFQFARLSPSEQSDILTELHLGHDVDQRADQFDERRTGRATSRLAT